MDAEFGMEAEVANNSDKSTAVSPIDGGQLNPACLGNSCDIIPVQIGKAIHDETKVIDDNAGETRNAVAVQPECFTRPSSSTPPLLQSAPLRGPSIIPCSLENLRVSGVLSIGSIVLR